jgi:hypothetical protein
MASDKVILSTKYADLLFDEEKSILTETWKEATAEMTDDEYKAFQHDKIKATEEVMPRLFLCDTKKFAYPMVPEMQEWTDNILNAFWAKIKLECFAMLTSEGFIEQLALEGLMEDREQEHTYAFQFFSDIEKAKSWLLTQKSPKKLEELD